MIQSLFNQLQRLLSGIYDPLAVIFELLLIGLSINWCVGILQGTRGTRLLKGLLTILIVVTLLVRLLSAQMGWTRLELLYRYFVIGLAFIALVAFQPELRRAILRAGDVRLLRRGAPRSKVVAALVESAGYLSRNHFGALIAIQREVGLRNWTENGTYINAEVSANLLNTIFFPNSALHDLGVIIQRDRILAANCQFPQADSEEVDTSLGSRHRAAIGMSSESDALVLVVSEETGTISLADQGQLVRFLSLEQLTDELTIRLGGHLDTVNERRRGFLRPDWRRLVRRMAAVAPLTLVIWYLADQASQTQAEGVKVELNIRHEQDPTLQVDVLQPQPTVFNVTFRGSTRAIEAVRNLTAAKPLLVDWTLPEEYAVAGDRTIDARLVLDTLSQVRARGLTVQSVSPPLLQFTTDRLVTGRVPVRVQSEAARVAEAQIDPPEVQVSLRSRDWEGLREDQRFAIVRLDEQLRGAAANQTLTLQNVPIAPTLGGRPIVHRTPAEVNVALRVVGQRVHRRLVGIVVEMAARPQLWQQYDVELRDRNEWLIDLEVEGEKAAVETLRPQDVRAFVPITSEQAVPGTAFRSEKVVVLLPDGVAVVGPPREVQFRLVERGSGAP